MPRTHARLYLRIWSDEDYTDLPMAAQWLYEALCSQLDINQAGVLSLTAKRWSRLCSDGSTALISRALGVLGDRRYVVTDPETEEVLVRTFIRNDEVWRQPNTLKNACTAARAVKSPKLRGTLRDELLKLDIGTIERMKTPPGHESAADAVRRTIKALGGRHTPDPVTPSEGYDDTNGVPIGDGKIDGAARAGDGVSTCTSSSVDINSSSFEPRKNLRGTRIPDDFAQTPALTVWARRECPDVDLDYETRQFVDYWSAKAGKDATKLDWPRTWQTWIRRAQREAASRPGTRPQPRPARDPLPADPAAALDDLRRRAAARQAAEIAGLVYRIEPQPPSNHDHPRQWERARNIEWIDQHAPQIKDALVTAHDLRARKHEAG